MKAGSLCHMEPAPLGVSHIRTIARVDCLPALEKQKAEKQKWRQNKQMNIT